MQNADRDGLQCIIYIVRSLAFHCDDPKGIWLQTSDRPTCFFRARCEQYDRKRILDVHEKTLGADAYTKCFILLADSLAVTG